MFEFRRAIRHLERHPDFPDYKVVFNRDDDKVTFTNREKWWLKNKRLPENPLTNNADTYRKAAEILPDGEDVDEYFGEWIDFWIDTGCADLKNADAAFLGFCKTRTARLMNKP